MSDLYKEIANSSSQTESVQEKNSEIIWLVFNAGEKFYAIDSSLVQEVMRNSDCYPLPFVPRYMPGVINSYGTPYAVVNLENFFADSQDFSQNSRFYLVLKDKNNISFQVSDIQEFHTQSKVTFDTLLTENEGSFFTGTVSFDEIVAPVLDTNAIIEKVKKDIEAQ